MSVYPIPESEVNRWADLSDDRTYRYALGRSWGDGKRLAFLMLNPSIADGAKDDNTIRKCVGFARRLDYDGILVQNLYAYRATKVADLWRARRGGADIVGPETDRRLRNLLTVSASIREPVVAAWGAHAPADRVRALLSLPHADALRCLAVTDRGVPRHPLMLGYEHAALRPLADAS